MHGTRNHGHHRRGPGWDAPAAPMYWGWSPANGQMEMMDLRGYLDAMRAAYDQALDDLYDRLVAVPGYMGPGGQPFTIPLPPPPYGGRRRGKGRRHHGHHDHGACGDDDHGCGGCDDRPQHKDGHGRHGKGHGHDHGCGKRRDCSCECCIVDADIVVYARCGELRVVPVEIENDTRKDREDVTLDVSDVRSAGGAKLPWRAVLNPPGPLTIKGCTTAEFELLVAIQCDRKTDDGKDDEPAVAVAAEPEGGARRVARAAKAAAPPPEAEAIRVNLPRRESGDVDSCTVGYVTISVGGCLVRPIVVAIAVLPDHCGAYHAGCACASCC